ncbi:autophagy-related protein 9A-like [Homarus americanus]|uniref:Autophagy-related protein 9 n=1 Tax=Homarus americanus TaxID=6706 RepID=A0A8J5N391_HOMAM|nr:autophagy-related protein 9A-like [Homarus americanus]KAG7172558.1 Autophagy-related protein 9A-like [Homarus americanus]
MSQNFQTNYQPLGGASDRDVIPTEVDVERDDDLSPDTHTSMVFHVVPKSSKSRWNHLEDLDSFFTRVYQYHQNHGLLCMMLQQIFELAQFIFIIVFTSFLFTCVDYDILFRNKFPPDFNVTLTDKITLPDAIRTHDQCMEHYTWKMVIVILLASVFWVLRLFHAGFTFFQFWEIKLFFNKALGIHDQELGNITWEEVEQRVMDVQVEQRMCIHKEVLTELDIYHRILRFTNYFIAMVNKEIIPLKFEVPFNGEMVFLTKGLRFNIEMLLFWGPWAPFKNNWHLSDEYKRLEKRHELAEQLNKRFLYTGIANLVLFPFVLIFQILYSFFYYAEMIKREPGSLGSRRWSHYGEVYLRHFNELDHEMTARLNRGYKAATQYMNIFSSPVLAIVAKHMAFACGAVFAVLAALSVYDEDVLQVEHVLTFMTVMGAVLAGCRVFIPDENLVFCPELLLRRVLAEVHYLPDHWREKAHTSRVRQEFSQLFQYRAVHMLEELVSPIVTPLILIFRLRFKALDIVDFYRNFTVEVVGVGDVCSFAQMDVRRHGSPTWQPDILSEDLNQPDSSSKPGMTTDGGKTELSLIHFTMTNPKWTPPQESSAFITALRTQAQRDMNALPTVQEENALFSSLNSLSCDGGLGMAATSLFRPPWMATGPQVGAQLQQSFWSPRGLRGGMSHVEGSRHGPSGGILSSIQQMGQSSVEGPIGTSSITSGPIIDPVLAPSTIGPSSMMGRSLGPPMPQDLTAVDMSLSTLYLHELHQRHRHRAMYTDTPQNPPSGPQGPPGGAFHTVPFHSGPPPDSGAALSVSFQQAQEKTPLLAEP